MGGLWEWDLFSLTALYNYTPRADTEECKDRFERYEFTFKVDSTWIQSPTANTECTVYTTLNISHGEGPTLKLRRRTKESPI